MASSRSCFGRMTFAPYCRPHPGWRLAPIRLKLLLVAITQVSSGGAFLSLRKYSKMVGVTGGSLPMMLIFCQHLSAAPRLNCNGRSGLHCGLWDKIVPGETDRQSGAEYLPNLRGQTYPDSARRHRK